MRVPGCLGELDKERKATEAEKKLQSQIEEGLREASISSLRECVVSCLWSEFISVENDLFFFFNTGTKE